ncbi:GMC oxidoreductase [Aquincola tertiaricarbonis]|uniref:Cholesterol oxidase n=1 Tax=Aquincola tertiaricarbonis TaxID=391953 RepID=A0ABY4SJC7_AQUTE|nr:GMC oxidoreductase [Aquincola tertiaricarbonis]URI11279.1 GMC oxidoreductase [Aquincola tertiaricarbonis]
MKRRDLLKQLGLGSAAAGLPLTSQALLLPRDYRSLVPEIYASAPTPPAHTRAIVIGSGFGGAISALRLAQAGITATVLERGFAWPNHPTREIFTQDTLPDGRGFWFRDQSKYVFGVPGLPIDRFGGVLDVSEYENMDVWRGACVGGGSVVFTGVMIQPQQRYFDALFGGTVSYAEMNATYFPRVRQMLQLSAMPSDIYNSAPFSHSRRWNSDMRKAGYTPTWVDGIWNWNVVRQELAGSSRPSCTVGLSNFGNSNGAKFDLNQNYLKQAKATGRVGVYAGHEVRRIYRDGTRYLLEVAKRSPDGTLLASYNLTCDMLFLAAGSIGTSELLVRAKALGDLPLLNEHVGRGWGTNGDSAVARVGAFDLGVTTGSACASMIHDTSGGLPVTLENWYAPAVPVSVGLGPSLGMSFDTSNRGSFVYDAATDRARLLWPAAGNNDTVAAMRAVNNRIALRSFTLPANVPPLLKDVDASFTGHPLGGAVLGKATDAYGRVLNYPNLYVMDGAAIPGNTGAVNPSLTISALAERNIERIIAAGG